MNSTRRLPSLFPTTKIKDKSITDGYSITAADFCKRKIKSDPDCHAHYEKLANSGNAYFQCPYGFTTKSFEFEGEKYAISSVIAHPRYGTENERRIAKDHSSNRCSRAGIDQFLLFLNDLGQVRADAVAEATKVLPQAFHELRKLNAAVIQNTEIATRSVGDNRNLASVKAAAELMRNSFDILEALSNMDVMRLLPREATVNVYDLCFKMKRIHQERAKSKNMNISLEGNRVIIRGSQKSFPLIPAVLLENAIKYGKPASTIVIRIINSDKKSLLTIENETKETIDPIRCFDRGVRFSKNAEGGGFGLYLAKEIVEAHNGSIWCETGIGTVRFAVELPLHAVAASFNDY